MTQHWWMHWFWVTVGALLGVLACQCWCAPQGPYQHQPTFQPRQHVDPTDQAAHFMPLLSDLEHHPTAVDYGGAVYDEEDTYGAGGAPAGLFAHVPKLIGGGGHHEDPFAVPHETTFIPIHSLAPQQGVRKLEPTHEEIMLADEDHHTKEDVATRLAKAIGVTTALPGLPVQFKNRNPFINEEMHAVNRPQLVAAEGSSPVTVVAVAMTSAPAPVPSVEPSEQPEAPPSSESPPEHEANPAEPAEDITNDESTPSEVTASSNVPVRQTESTEPAPPLVPLPTKEPTVHAPGGGIHPIPPWIPDPKQQDADSEEEEREMEQIDRITNALVEEETAEEGEAITRGRMTPDKGLGTASIVGIALGFVGIIGMAGAAAGFLLYKRSLLNKPQTLNDKISNPDYSSYIDDTLRDNSEEMYSLDNDSFLNSLEAMTIQNYWTESVKHTKL